MNGLDYLKSIITNSLTFSKEYNWIKRLKKDEWRGKKNENLVLYIWNWNEEFDFYVGGMRYLSLGDTWRKRCGASSISFYVLQYSQGILMQDSWLTTSTIFYLTSLSKYLWGFVCVLYLILFIPVFSWSVGWLQLPTYKRASTLRAKLLYAISSNTGFELS